MAPYDYTDAPPPRDFGLIPHGTIATVTIHLRAGGAGEDGMLKRSAKGDCEMLDAEFTVIDGAYSKRKFWGYFVLHGETAGHEKAAEISRGTLRAILDSALGLKPDDASPKARAARTVSLKDFEGRTFIARIGVEEGREKNDGSGEYWPDKNILAGVITPDKKEWRSVEQPPPFNGGRATSSATPSNSAPPVTRPGWAT
jgi:hypothetical protein